MNPNGRGLSSADAIRSLSSSGVPTHRLLASSSCARRACFTRARRASRTSDRLARARRSSACVCACAGRTHSVVRRDVQARCAGVCTRDVQACAGAMCRRDHACLHDGHCGWQAWGSSMRRRDTAWHCMDTACIDRLRSAGALRPHGAFPCSPCRVLAALVAHPSPSAPRVVRPPLPATRPSSPRSSQPSPPHPPPPPTDPPSAVHAANLLAGRVPRRAKP
jgi:hypothetical protein